MWVYDKDYPKLKQIDDDKSLVYVISEKYDELKNEIAKSNTNNKLIVDANDLKLWDKIITFMSNLDNTYKLSMLNSPPPGKFCMQNDRIERKYGDDKLILYGTPKQRNQTLDRYTEHKVCVVWVYHEKYPKNNYSPDCNCGKYSTTNYEKYMNVDYNKLIISGKPVVYITFGKHVKLADIIFESDSNKSKLIVDGDDPRLWQEIIIFMSKQDN